MHANHWRGSKYASEADVLENLIMRAVKITQTPFDDLPEALRTPEPSLIIQSSSTHCFANALARCLPTNVEAANCYADRFRYDNLDMNTCVRACEEAGVPVMVFNKPCPTKKRALRASVEMMVKMKRFSSCIMLFSDHALSIQIRKKLVFSLSEWNDLDMKYEAQDSKESYWL